MGAAASVGEKLENAAKADVVDFLKEEFEWRCAEAGAVSAIVSAMGCLSYC